MAFDERYYVVVYFHSKPFMRNMHEIILTYLTFHVWRGICAKFKVNKDLGICGVLLGHTGNYVWMNFWWASTKYLQSPKPPVTVRNRYIYEFWLTNRKDNSQVNFKSINMENTSERYN